MVALKVRKFGNSLGVILPKDVLKKLGAAEGQKLFLVESEGNQYQLSREDADFEAKMEKAKDIMSRYRETLRILSK